MEKNTIQTNPRLTKPASIVDMATITFSGDPITTSGELPPMGAPAPDFTVVGSELQDIQLKDFAGKRLVLNIFPSIDTGVCAMSVRQFNERAAGLDNAAVLCVSRDLPFALTRFCGAEGIGNVAVGSDFRNNFGETYGVVQTTGPLAGLLARAVVVIDADGTVIYTEQVPEITQEPNYDAAIAALG